MLSLFSGLSLFLMKKRDNNIKVEDKMERLVKKEKAAEEIQEMKKMDPFKKNGILTKLNLERPNKDEESATSNKLKEKDRNPEQPPKLTNLKMEKIGFWTTWNARSSSQTQECGVVSQNGLSDLERHETVKDDIDEETLVQVSVTNEIRKRIYAVKLMLGSMDDGEISISAYDTAWVALVKDVSGGSDGDDAPQFPSTLEWIASNQLADGSWGDSQLFSVHDRILNTLACVIALRSWNLHPEKCEKGIAYFKENLSRLQDENGEHMPIGFEVAFPSLLDIARSLNVEVPNDSPFLKDVFAMRDLKLNKIPREVMHKVPTTLLHSLEGMPNLDWKLLLKLQSQDGSFLFSPSSTAFALMQTKDEKTLKYLNKVVTRFNGGVPSVYPVDLFEHIWAVDRLERLGISRYFQQEIKDSMNYVSRYWTEKGICWARNSEVQDIDDTAMGFRLLRLYGHQVSANAFKQFEKSGEFFCFAGQSSQAVTGILNLYRASQVLFPGEHILEDAKHFSVKFLTEKRAANEFLDKWIITKDLPGEVGYALDVPWYASLPRLETSFYIHQYGGQNDVWIGKTLYRQLLILKINQSFDRMPYVNNDVYLELAVLDYNNCQALHCTEWGKIQRWYTESGLEKFGLSIQTLLYAFFLAAASIFEPERSQERLAWAKTAALLETITSFIDEEGKREIFVHQFNDGINERESYSIGRRLNRSTTERELLRILLRTLDHLGLDTFLSQGHEISHYLHQAWQRWLKSWQNEGNRSQSDAELLVQTINLTAGCWSEEQQRNPQYQALLEVTNNVCHQLRNYQSNKAHENGSRDLRANITTTEIESSMQELVQLVLQNSNGIQFDIKKTFLIVAKSFYYTAYFDPGTIDSHIAKVLFHKVL